MINILTIDVEDWFQTQNLSSRIQRQEWDFYEKRIMPTTQKILSILEAYNAKATFFILGWNAERFPELVSMISSHGHECGTHGYYHELIYNQSPAEFEYDLLKSIDIIENISNHKIQAFRAPTWSINKDTGWALNILGKNKIRYDSSILSVNRKIGGYPGYKNIYPHVLEEYGLIEVPVSVLQTSFFNIPFAGGGYFRALPFIFSKWAIRRINDIKQPAVLYFHPWELDPGQPRMKLNLSNIMCEKKHYMGLCNTEQKLNRLLSFSSFDSIHNVINLKVENSDDNIGNKCIRRKPFGVSC